MVMVSSLVFTLEPIISLVTVSFPTHELFIIQKQDVPLLLPRSGTYERSKAVEGRVYPAGLLYIGGATDLESRTGEKHDLGFSGCINWMRINQGRWGGDMGWGSGDTWMVGGEKYDDIIDWEMDPITVTGNIKDEMCTVIPVPMKTTPTQSTTTATPTTTTSTTVATPTTTTSTTAATTTLKPCFHDSLSFTDPGSYVALISKMVTHKKRAKIDLTIHISTKTPEGLILWKKSPRIKDYIAMGLVGGRVQVEIEIGNAKVTLESEVEVADGELHIVRLTKENGGEVILAVDQVDHSS